jgi:hypothetical protein
MNWSKDGGRQDVFQGEGSQFSGRGGGARKFAHKHAFKPLMLFLLIALEYSGQENSFKYVQFVLLIFGTFISFFSMLMFSKNPGGGRCLIFLPPPFRCPWI